MVILAAPPLLVKKISKIIAAQTSIICPDFLWLRVIIFLYSASFVHRLTFSKLYAQLLAEHPDALFIYEQPLVGLVFPEKHAGKSRYIKFFDPALKEMKDFGTSRFLDAYLDVRKILDYRLDVYIDYIHLYNQGKFINHFQSLENHRVFLKNFFGIDGKYVVLNINCKKYFGETVLNRKQIHLSKRYECLIDRLIEKGYAVVLQGREEQPLFRSRRGFYDYAHSSICSVEYDFALYSEASFAISSKSGSENFSAVCNIPLLGLEYVELCSMSPNPKSRFYPKGIFRKSTGHFLSWEEFLKSPCYFDIGPNSYDPDIQYESMRETELLAAVDEFLILVESPLEGWTNYTPLQLEFKKHLTPLHLDLFYVAGVPCDAYLKGCSKKCVE